MLESRFNKVEGLKAYNFIQKETQTQEFSCEYREIFKNTYFEKYQQTAASELWTHALIWPAFSSSLTSSSLKSLE